MMAARKRNPLLGGIFALLFIGYGSYRFYQHFNEIQILATYQLVLAGAFVLYGLFVGYSVLTQDKKSNQDQDEQNQ